MEWVPANFGIDENETSDALAKEARKLHSDKLPFVVTLNDINSEMRFRLKVKTFVQSAIVVKPHYLLSCVVLQQNELFQRPEVVLGVLKANKLMDLIRFRLEG
ncbi:hypothetical protein TNCT_211281 [Trichonephila clavata]|uniref:RNase H type-1 domain-containing protein n=1 Tax=Trichonephila clavata TaxID=2740835 RepID=A0A8X6HCE5_TRICU|nr:hypothetical protein TNCT_211281 [Trichonephila clavata]